MKQPFSVLMSLYKGEKPAYALACFRSLLAQTVPASEWVIVEDGPLTREMYQLLDFFDARYPGLIRRVPLEKNQGLGLALQAGVPKCSYELIARMDTDDIARPDRFERQLAEFARHSELDICGSWVDEFETDPVSPSIHPGAQTSTYTQSDSMTDGQADPQADPKADGQADPQADSMTDGQIEYRADPLTKAEYAWYRKCVVTSRTVPLTQEKIAEYQKRRDAFNHMAVMYRKDTVLRAGNYQSCPLMEDTLLWVHMLQAGAKCMNIPEPLVYARIGKDMYERRGGWSYFKKYREGRRKVFETGYISYKDYLVTIVVQFVVACMPNRLRGWLFRKVLHKGT